MAQSDPAEFQPISRPLPCSPRALWTYFRGRLSPARLLINAAVAEHMPALPGEIIELGATEKGNHRRFAPGRAYVLSNLTGGPGVLALDALQMDRPDASVESFVAVSVLEHIPDPRQALREIHRTLRPGGRLLLIVPFLYPFHPAPSDFFRFTHLGLAELCADFRVVHSEALGNFFTTCALFLQRPVQWSSRGTGPASGNAPRRRRKALRLLATVTRLIGLVCCLLSRCSRHPDDYTCLYCLVLEKKSVA